MEISELTEKLACEYFSLTKRPLATMTVEEFKMFRDIAKQESASIVITSPVERETIKASEDTKTHLKDERDTEKSADKPVEQKPIQPVKTNVLKPVKPKTEKSSTNAMLAMLKAVPG